MNDYSLYKQAQNHVAEAHKWAANEQLARQALNGRERQNPLTSRAVVWIGKELISLGTSLKARAERRAAPIQTIEANESGV